VLILPAVQINIRAGEMPPQEANGTAYLKIPINALWVAEVSESGWVISRFESIEIKQFTQKAFALFLLVVTAAVRGMGLRGGMWRAICWRMCWRLRWGRRVLGRWRSGLRGSAIDDLVQLTTIEPNAAALGAKINLDAAALGHRQVNALAYRTQHGEILRGLKELIFACGLNGAWAPAKKAVWFLVKSRTWSCDETKAAPFYVLTQVGVLDGVLSVHRPNTMIARQRVAIGEQLEDLCVSICLVLDLGVLTQA
jgi:hypothetical protein